MLRSTLIDEIGYTPIEKREANLFFNLISEMYEKLSIIVTSKSPKGRVPRACPWVNV